LISQLIHHTINNFNIAPDKTAITRIHDSLSTLRQARELRMREAESSLKSESLKHT
jgi:kinetochore protein Spc24, fungi type